MKEALRYSAALLGELRTSLLRWAGRRVEWVRARLPVVPAALALHVTHSATVSFLCTTLLHASTLDSRPPEHCELCMQPAVLHQLLHSEPVPSPLFAFPPCVAAAPRSTTSCTCRRATSCATWRCATAVALFMAVCVWLCVVASLLWNQGGGKGGMPAAAAATAAAATAGAAASAVATGGWLLSCRERSCCSPAV